MADQDTNSTVPQNKKLSPLLLLGILFMPYFFVWFLLKPGYSKTVRILGFSWMLIVLLIIINPDKESQKLATERIPDVEDSSIASDSIEVDTPATKTEEVVEISFEDLMPQKERNLIDVLKKAWAKSEYSYTESEKYKLIKERKSTLSNGYQMTDWVGTVESAQYHQEANEISLAILLYQGDQSIDVGTGASADPKYRAPTTIKEGSALFDKALDLNHGDKVKFSGTLYLKSFSPWSAKRADDNPLDSFGGLDFLTKFSKLQKLD